MFSHRIPSYEISSDEHECIPIYSFELNHIALSIDKFQLTEDHDQAQNNVLKILYSMKELKLVHSSQNFFFPQLKSSIPFTLFITTGIPNLRGNKIRVHAIIFD
jgi:hypothetical protein